MPNSSPTYDTTLRIIMLLQHLRQNRLGRLTIEDLAERLEVDERTVRRYIAMLETGGDGLPPLVRRVRAGRRSAVELIDLPDDVGASIFQYAAVHAATRSLHDPVLGDSARDVEQRVAAGVSHTARSLVERVPVAFAWVPFGPKHYAEHEAVLDALVRGALRRKAVELVYETEIEPFPFAPWTIVLYRDGLYAWGRTLERRGEGAFRMLAVDRIEQARLLPSRSFRVPKDYDPEMLFEGRLGVWRNSDDDAPRLVRIAFDPSVVSRVQARTWPGFVGWHDGEDGWPVLSLEIPVTPEVKTWVISWGPLARVEGPRELRDMVADELRASLAMYDAG